MLCLFVTAAMAAFYFGLESPSRLGRTGWMAAFWLLLGLANMAKQFVPLMIAWPILAYLCWRQSAADRGSDMALRWLRGFVIAAGAGLGVHVLVTGVAALHWWVALGVSGDLGAYATMAAAFGVPMAWYFYRSGGWRAVKPLLPTALPGVLVTLAVFVPWLVYMRRLFPGFAEEVLSQEVTRRAAGTGGWAVKGPWTYLGALVTFSLPWLAFLPGAFATGLMRRFETDRRGLAYLLLWCLGLVFLMTASAAKREHYILPMLPALCLLMGHVADDVFFTHRWIRPRLARLLGLPYGLLGAVGVAATIAGWVLSGRDLRWIHMLLVTLVAAAPMTAAGVLMWRRRFSAVPPLMVASVVLVYVGYHHRGDLWDDRRAVADFAQTASTIIPPAAPVYHWNDSQARTVFYFSRYIPSVQRQLALVEAGPTASQADASSFRRWLQADADAAPWIFGYAHDAAKLAPEGYRSVLEITSREERRPTFVLYHRAGLPASGPTTTPR
jgi:4-amino-4-deoxy-L-arabinose transferase-like glycosyltransferase